MKRNQGFNFLSGILVLFFLVTAGCGHSPQKPESNDQTTPDKEKIRSVVKAHLDEIKACYEEGLKEKSNLAGKFILQWTVGDTGKVIEAHVKSTTLRSPQVENCSLKKLKTWDFPSTHPKELAVISYPFSFEPGD